MKNEKNRLQQLKNIEYFKQDIKPSDLITVYLSKVSNKYNYGIYPLLAPNNIIEKIMSHTTWDFGHQDGYPSVYENNENIEYFRYGNNNGIEPLLISRNFNGIKNDYIEISQEFILFHDLYYEQKENKYYKLINGNEYLVIEIKDDEIKIRLKEIKEFLRVKNMSLILQFDMREHSTKTIHELELVDTEAYKNKELVYTLTYGDFLGLSTYNTWSRLLGKKLILPFSKKPNNSVERYINFGSRLV